MTCAKAAVRYEGDPQYKFLPSTRVRILRSATERSTIQKPQSGSTHLMRSAPRTLTARSMRRALSVGVSVSLLDVDHANAQGNRRLLSLFLPAGRQKALRLMPG